MKKVLDTVSYKIRNMKVFLISWLRRGVKKDEIFTSLLCLSCLNKLKS